MAVLIPSFFLFGFSWGVRFQVDKKEAAKPIFKKPRKKKENKIECIEARNIDNYYGPMSKQEDIK